MKFIIDNGISITVGVVLVALAIRFSIRVYYAEKRRHLELMLRENENKEN